MFNVGDRVVYRSVSPLFGQGYLENKCGTVIDRSKSGFFLTVQFDEYINGHDGNGVGKYGYCRYIIEDDLMGASDFESATDSEFLEFIND